MAAGLVVAVLAVQAGVVLGARAPAAGALAQAARRDAAPSRIWIDRRPRWVDFGNSGPTVVAALSNLPSGHYEVSWSLNISRPDGGGNGGRFICLMVSAGDSLYARQAGAAYGPQDVPASAVDVVPLPRGGRIQLECTASDDPLSAAYIRLVAVLYDEVTATSS